MVNELTQFSIRLFQEIKLIQPQLKLQNSHFATKQQNSQTPENIRRSKREWCRWCIAKNCVLHN